MTVTAQILGIIGMALNILSFQFKSKKNILIGQLLGSVAFVANMFMLGAIMGGILNIIGIARAAVYMDKERLKISPKALNLLFVVVYLVSYALVFTVFGKTPNATNLLVEFIPIIGMTVMTFGFSGKSARTVRLCSFTNSPCWLVYNCINLSIGGILCEIFSIVSSVSAFIRLDLKGKAEKKEA